MKNARTIACPRCGNSVRIPLYWTLGIEGIFRCRSCRQPFKTGYKMGALLSAVGLCLSMILMQVMVYLTSSYSLILFALLFIPVWFFFAFYLRKAWMIRKVRNAVRLSPEEPENPEEEPTEERSPEEEYFTLPRLPRDTSFEEEKKPTQEEPFSQF